MANEKILQKVRYLRAILADVEMDPDDRVEVDALLAEIEDEARK